MGADLDRDSIRAELESTRALFHRVVDSMSEEDWRRRSRNRAWTNGELLFHMTFGFILLPALMFIIKLFGLLPDGVSRAYARLLNFFTPAFNRINALGPRAGGKIYGRESLAGKYDKVHLVLLKQLDLLSESEWNRGTHYPTRWDPAFKPYMTVGEVFHYVIDHFHHHLGQISR